VTPEGCFLTIIHIITVVARHREYLWVRLVNIQPVEDETCLMVHNDGSYANSPGKYVLGMIVSEIDFCRTTDGNALGFSVIKFEQIRV
jgi:hypothetical protein